jgi:hypothetical protein
MGILTQNAIQSHKITKNKGSSLFIMYMANLDFEIYGGKNFKDLCKEVVDRSQSKKNQVDILITEVRSFIKGPNDALQFIPHLKSLLEVGVKNDEQLIKLTAVLQRLQSTQLETSGGDDGMLTEEEKEELRKNSVEVLKELKAEVDTPVTSSLA